MGDVMKLSALNDGQVAVIKCIHLSSKDTKRLFYIGFYVGAEIRRLRQAPFSDPILFYVRGNQIILRKTDAQQIEVEVRE